MRRVSVAGLLALVAAASTAAAQTPPPPATAAPSPDAAARPSAVAVRIAGPGPSLDGRLDDAAWAAATPAAGFVQRLPAEGAAPTERTEVRFLYDDRALWIGARMWTRDPSGIVAPVGRRDALDLADNVLVSLDTYLDRRTAYSFGVTAAGTRLDFYHPADDSERLDGSFSPVWEARVARDSLGWTAEMRIPFSQLRFSPGATDRWGMNLRRWTMGREEEDLWAPIPTRTRAWSSLFGELRGIQGVRPSRRVELSPYVSTGLRTLGDADPRDPFTDRREASAGVGADVKVGLGPNLTLDATVNPDFGQVEADPAEVNLSAFETFFSERRPFFTEGSQLLSGGGAGYFYSRRIGAAPRLPASADYVRYPRSSTILGAAKLTGRLPSGLSVGVLAAVTDRERALLADTAAGTRETLEVEPRTGYAVARLQQEMRGGAAAVGVTATALRRDLEAGSALEARMHRSAFAGGVDGSVRLGGGTYELTGSLGLSRVEGDSVALLRTQRSSARYFQRPDAEHARLDPSRTSLSGFTGSLGAARIAGEHWVWETGVTTTSPGFELNDAGRLSSADQTQWYGELRWRERTPRGPFRSVDVFYTPSAVWNHDGVRTATQQYLDANLTWKNLWRSYLTVLWIPRATSATMARGGPLVGTVAQYVGIAEVASANTGTVRWRGRLYYGETEEGDPTRRVSGGVTVRAGTRWELSVDPNWLVATTRRQYVGTLPGGGPEATFGSRYVFAALDRRELSAQIRARYLFSPDLALEAYAEPFAATGHFRDVGELPAARSRGLNVYAPDDPRVVREGSVTTVHQGTRSVQAADYDLRSFRSNAVLRWEWRPGSTLFVVWQQDREREWTREGRVDPGALAETLGSPGDNTLAIKVTYWIPLR